MAGTGATPGIPRVLRAMHDRAALGPLPAQGPLSRARAGRLTGLVRAGRRAAGPAGGRRAGRGG
ncbi:sugar kinase, partial [Streptomyces cinereospinus]